MESAQTTPAVPSPPAIEQASLDQLLQQFEARITTLRQVTANTSAERALTSWENALDNQAVLPIRCSPDGLPGGAFHRGMLLHPEQQLDQCALPFPISSEQALDAGIFARFFAEQKHQFLQRLTLLNPPNVRRPSSFVCDEAMVQAHHLSRGLAVWALLAEKRQYPSDIYSPRDLDQRGHWTPRVPPPPLRAWQPVERDIFETMLAWEPLLNRFISAWSSNALHDFSAAGSVLRQHIEKSTTPQVIAGEPFRELGALRCQVDTLYLNKRPFTPRPSLHLRFRRLRDKIYQNPALIERSEKVAEDVRFLLGSLELGVCQLAHAPVFQARPLGGRPIIRGRVRNHRWMLEPLRFFKQANLFCNRFYTRKGLGHRAIFLELHQFQRWLQCQPKTEPGWPTLLALSQQGLIAWEENRLEEFNQSLFALARALLIRAGLDLQNSF